MMVLLIRMYEYGKIIILWLHSHSSIFDFSLSCEGENLPVQSSSPYLNGPVCMIMILQFYSFL